MAYLMVGNSQWRVPFLALGIHACIEHGGGTAPRQMSSRCSAIASAAHVLNVTLSECSVHTAPAPASSKCSPPPPGTCNTLNKAWNIADDAEYRRHPVLSAVQPLSWQLEEVISMPAHVFADKAFIIFHPENADHLRRGNYRRQQA